MHCESWAWIEKLTLLVLSRVQFEWCCIIFTVRSLLLEQNRVCFSKGCCLLFTNSKCTLLPCFSLRCLGLETSLLNSPLSIFEMGEKFCEVKKGRYFTKWVCWCSDVVRNPSSYLYKIIVDKSQYFQLRLVTCFDFFNGLSFIIPWIVSNKFSGTYVHRLRLKEIFFCNVQL